MAVKKYKYNDKTQLTKNINVSELKCKCGGTHDTKVDTTHVNNIQKFMDQNGYDKVIFSSGYRCSKHDKVVGGSGKGQHVDGRATDQCFYKNGKIVPAKEVCCKAQDFGFKGIAYITKNYVHLDNRLLGKYRGDETVDFSNNVGGDFYKYFGIKKEEEKKPVTTTLKFKKGDKVILNGYLYVDAKGSKKGAKKTNYKGSITKVATGSKPYHIGTLGWVAEADLKLQTTTTETKVTYKTVTGCSSLNLRTSAKYGNNIYKAVKKGTKLEYLGITNGWAKVKYDKKTLYCGKSYLK